MHCKPSLLFAIGRSELHGHRLSRKGGAISFFLLHAPDDVLALAQEAIASAHVFLPLLRDLHVKLEGVQLGFNHCGMEADRKSRNRDCLGHLGNIR